MALLQNNKAVFYHPLDNTVESIKIKAWTGVANNSGPGKVGNAMSAGTNPNAILSGLTADYGSTIGAAKMAFLCWTKEPVAAPSPSPTFGVNPVTSGATSVAGGGEAGASIEVFVNGISIGMADAIVSNLGLWSITGISPPLSLGDVITAKQTSAGALFQSGASNPVTVVDITATAIPVIDSPLTKLDTIVTGTSTEIDGTTVSIKVNSATVGLASVFSGVWIDLVPALQTGDVVTATALASGLSESPVSIPVTVLAQPSATPTADFPLTSSSTIATGTGVDGAAIEVFVNGSSIGSADAPVTLGTWSKTAITITVGNTLTARQTETGKLQSGDSNVVEVGVTIQTLAPTVNFPIGEGSTSVSGTGVNGATVEIFVNGNSLGDASSVVSGGVWMKSFAPLSTGDIIIARQKSVNELQSANSNAVTIGAQFVVGANESEFLSLSTGVDSVHAIALSSTTFAVTYRDPIAGAGLARIGTVNGLDITFGLEKSFNATLTTNMFSLALSPNQFVILYSTGGFGGDFGTGTATIATVTGTTINLGSTSIFGSNAKFTTGIVLNEFRIVVVWRNKNTNDSLVAVGTIALGSIAFASPITLLAGVFTDGGAFFSMAALSSTKFVLAFQDGTTTPIKNFGKAVIGTISGTGGTVVTLGVKKEFLSFDGADNISATAVDTTNFIITYRDNANLGHGTAIVGTISGTDITFGVKKEFLASPVGSLSAAPLSGGRVLVAYQDIVVGNNGKATIGTVTGSDIAFVEMTDFLVQDGADFISTTVMEATFSETKFIVAYRDNSDFGHGTAKAGSIGGTFSFGFKEDFSIFPVIRPTITSLSSNKFVVAWYSTTGDGVARIGTVSETNVTWGVFKSFRTNFTSSNQIALTALSQTKFVVAYEESSNISTVRVGDVSGLAITFGLPTTWIAGITQQDIVALSTTKFALVTAGFVLAGNQLDIGSTVIGTVTGTGITLGSGKAFSSNAGWLSTAAISSTSFVIAWDSFDSSSPMIRSVVGTLIANDITFHQPTDIGSIATKDSHTPSRISITVLSPTTLAIAYKDELDAGRGIVKVGSISGTNITYGVGQVFTADPLLSLPGIVWRSLSVSPFSTTSVIIAWNEVRLSTLGFILGPGVSSKVKIATVTGTTFVFDTDVPFLPVGLATMSPSNFLNAISLLDPLAPLVPATSLVVSYSASDRGSVKVAPK